MLRGGLNQLFVQFFENLQTNRAEAVMKTQSSFMENVKSSYLVLVIAMLGIFAFISAVLIAWPALAYIGSKLFN